MFTSLLRIRPCRVLLKINPSALVSNILQTKKLSGKKEYDDACLSANSTTISKALLTFSLCFKKVKLYHRSLFRDANTKVYIVKSR